MSRFFNKRMRKLLLITSGNKCAICNEKLNESFHADHIVPYSKNGSTTLNNAQALCAQCNQKKGNKIVKH